VDAVTDLCIVDLRKIMNHNPLLRFPDGSYRPWSSPLSVPMSRVAWTTLMVNGGKKNAPVVLVHLFSRKHWTRV
jgi:hypothetical protein